MPFHSASRIAPHGRLAAVAIQAVDEQHAVQMIGLVLQAAGQVAGPDHLDEVPSRAPPRPASQQRSTTAPAAPGSE
jgi:hypothetical protein